MRILFLFLVIVKLSQSMSDKECELTIRYRNKAEKSKLVSNFHSESENNWNEEILNDSDGYDNTLERVDGGKLAFIAMTSYGKFCVSYITITCGPETLSSESEESEKSITLDALTFSKAWTKSGKTQKLSTDGRKKCVWFSQYGNTDIRIVYVDKDALTKCENDSDNICVLKYISVF